MRRHKTVSEVTHREQLTPQRLPYVLPGTQGVCCRAKHTVAGSYPACSHVGFHLENSFNPGFSFPTLSTMPTLELTTPEHCAWAPLRYQCQ